MMLALLSLVFRSEPRIPNDYKLQPVAFLFTVVANYDIIDHVTS